MTAAPLTDFPSGHPLYGIHPPLAAGEQAAASTTAEVMPSGELSARPQHSSGQCGADAQSAYAGAASERVIECQAGREIQLWNALDDPLLYLAAASLDDLERTWIAASNRLRQLTRDEPDKDGEERGFGLTPDHPGVRAQQAVVDGLAVLAHGAELTLKRRLRQHPLHGWVKATVGVGEKQAARLLAAIGDPYWNTLHDRPRTVSELWAYAGLHVVQVGHPQPATHEPCVGLARSVPAVTVQAVPNERSPQGSGIPTDHFPVADTQALYVGGERSGGHPDHGTREIQPAFVGVAARRRKGQRANWSTVAKMRAYLIAESCMKQRRSPYRDLYDQRKAATEARRHQVPCTQCDGKGSVAIGTPWRDGHRHADALRIVAKAILRDLWLAARDVHKAAP